MKPVQRTISAAIAEIRAAVAAARHQGQRIGLVPTMGALHEGHASLIRRARERTDFVVVTIFVNPAQFGPHEDFSRYPRSLEGDLALCAREGAAAVFAPAPEEIYPPFYQTFVEVRDLSQGMEGAARPGHFQGVATVVLKLFHIVQPDEAFFGQKDAQQARVIQQMVRDLNLPIKLGIVATARESDGLALSSRNHYLSPEQRRHAAVLYQALDEARISVLAGESRAEVIRDKAKARIEKAPGAVLDYFTLVKWETLQPVDELAGQILIAGAVRFGATRLIDNVLVKVPITMA